MEFKERGNHQHHSLPVNIQRVRACEYLQVTILFDSFKFQVSNSLSLNSVEDVDFDRITDSQNPAELSIFKKKLRETPEVSSTPSTPSSPKS